MSIRVRFGSLFFGKATSKSYTAGTKINDHWRDCFKTSHYYMNSSPWVDKMNQILYSDWLLKRARWGYLATHDCSLSHKKWRGQGGRKVQEGTGGRRGRGRQEGIGARRTEAESRIRKVAGTRSKRYRKQNFRVPCPPTRKWCSPYHIINPLWPKYAWSRWLDIGLLLCEGVLSKKQNQRLCEPRLNFFYQYMHVIFIFWECMGRAHLCCVK